MSKPIRSTGFPVLGRTASGGTVRFTGESHMLTVATTGAGKGQHVILPNLILHPGSVITLDVKSGENAVYTARWRNEGPLRQPAYIYDPFFIVPDADLPASGRAMFDPVAFVRHADSPFAAAQQVADSLIVPGGNDPHWSSGAALILTGTLLFVATSPVIERPDVVAFLAARGISLPRSMRTVWGICTDPRLSDLHKEMIIDDDALISTQGTVLSGLEIEHTSEGPKWRLSANVKEFGAIRSTLRTQCMSTLSDKDLIASMEGNSLDFGTLSRTPASVYIVLPGKWAERLFRYLRLFLGVALSQIEDAGLVPYEGDKRRPSTLVILDEAASLGKFPLIVDAMGRMRAYGLKFWMFVQNLGQLKNVYGDGWSAISGNCGVVQYFGGTRDDLTMDKISKWTGEHTARESSSSQNSNPGGGGFSSSDRLYGRPVMFPSDVASLEKGKQVLLFDDENGPFEAGMLAQYDPTMFPEYRAYMASSQRKRTVYRTPGKAARPAAQAPAPAVAAQDFSNAPGAAKAASAGPAKTTSNARFDWRGIRDKVAAPFTSSPLSASSPGAGETVFEGRKPGAYQDQIDIETYGRSHVTYPTEQANNKVIIRCPVDGKGLRVPTDRGTIEVSCPCGHKWLWSPTAKLASR